MSHMIEHKKIKTESFAFFASICIYIFIDNNDRYDRVSCMMTHNNNPILTESHGHLSVSENIRIIYTSRGIAFVESAGFTCAHISLPITITESTNIENLFMQYKPTVNIRIHHLPKLLYSTFTI